MRPPIAHLVTDHDSDQTYPGLWKSTLGGLIFPLRGMELLHRPYVLTFTFILLAPQTPGFYGRA